MKNRILGISALLAVVVFCLMFSACPPIDDGKERAVTFINRTSGTIVLNTDGDPNPYTLRPASSQVDTSSQIIIRKTGFDLELKTITVTTPKISDPWDYIELRGDLIGTVSRNGIKLGGGTVSFFPKWVEGGNTYFNPFKIGVVSLDE